MKGVAVKTRRFGTTATAFVCGLALLMSAPIGSTALAADESASGNEVLNWNQIFIDTLIATSTPNSSSQRLGAIVHTAIFDALNGIERRYTPIFVHGRAPHGASRRAASSPRRIQRCSASSRLNRSRSMRSTTVTRSTNRTLQRMAAYWADDPAHARDPPNAASSGGRGAKGPRLEGFDGFSATRPAFTGGMAVGQWRPTPPAFGPMSAQGLAFTEMFVLDSNTQFQPEPPRTLTNSVVLGRFQRGQGARSEDRLDAHRGPDGTRSFLGRQRQRPLESGSESDRAQKPRLDVQEQPPARGSQHRDGRYALTFLSAKRFYGSLPTEVTWRPVTAVPLADTDGNPETAADLDWLPLVNTPSHPEYPAGHPGLNGAAATVLLCHFRDRQTFTLTTTGQPRSHLHEHRASVRRWKQRARVGRHALSEHCRHQRRVGKAIARYVNRNSMQRLRGKERE